MTPRVGVWFVGARGSVAVTSTVGALALRAGLAGQTGLVTMLPGVADAKLPDPSDFVIGGHDVSDLPLSKRAEQLVAGGVLPARLVEAVRPELSAVEARLRPGVAAGDGTQRAALDRLAEDLREFRADHGLDHVVVVDVSSTEAPMPEDSAHASLVELERALDLGESPLPTSSLYAYAAFRAGCPLVAFTPSPGPNLAALQELALTCGVPWAGSDGKTGETLVKAALAPMFATRALRVRSWASYNMLGGGDGQTLADPDAAASKLATKGEGLTKMLGHAVDGPLHIDYVPDFGDWKTAWDHISFEGFLGVRMSLQFTWAGCDSALAAPLVLDLVRLVSRAHHAGLSGPIGQLGFFFKSPAGSDEHRLAAQWDELVAFCSELDAAP
jgi:myo-inositol-1-phosphate synthase